MLAAVREPPVTHDVGYIYNRGGPLFYISAAHLAALPIVLARARFCVSGKRG